MEAHSIKPSSLVLFSQTEVHLLTVLQYKDNLEARAKHADAPERFMDTELDLDEEVHRLQVGFSFF